MRIRHAEASTSLRGGHMRRLSAAMYARLGNEKYEQMIERYTRPEMARVWSEEHKLDMWLRVEILVSEGWARQCAISAADLEKIRAATYDSERARALERANHHDVISFLRSVQERLGPEGRFLHLGMTSSDMLDTALAVQLVEAGALIREALDTLLATVTATALHYRHTL